MTRRGAVGIHDMFFPDEYSETLGFIVTFSDGTQVQHSGGLATIPDEMIQQHGRVQGAEEITNDGRLGMFPKCKHTKCSACKTKEHCCTQAFTAYQSRSAC